MNDVHDLGGRAGLGAVEVEPHEPVFHAPWEGRVLGMVYLSLGLGFVNLDTFRSGIERMDPARYLAASYYERWLTSLETILAEAGVLARGYAPPAPPESRRYERPLAAQPRFAEGARVRTRTRRPHGHTRLPGYASQKLGVVVRARGGFVFPDTNAHGAGEQPQHLYAVRFDARELWGAVAEPGASVTLDLFEPYLEPAEQPPHAA
jgi:nitrile hydratase